MIFVFLYNVLSQKSDTFKVFKHHLLGFEIAQLEFHPPPLALFVVMLSKAHLTSHSRMSGSRWVITQSWLSGSWRSFLYSSSVYSCHFFLISSASVRSIPFPVLYRAHLCMKYSLGISNFLEEISSLSHSIYSLYFFAFITKESFLISPCYSLELHIQMGISFLFSFAFRFTSYILWLYSLQPKVEKLYTVSKKKRRKGKIYLFECRVPKKSKER